MIAIRLGKNSRRLYFQEGQGIPLQIAAKRVQHNDQPGPVALARPARHQPLATLTTFRERVTRCQTHHRVGRRPEQYVQQYLTVVLDQQTQLPRQGKDEMAVRDIQHLGQQLLAPLIRAYLATTGAEHRLTTVGDHFDRATLLTQQQMQTQLCRPARQHARYVANDRQAHLPALPSQITFPIIVCLKNLGDCYGTAPRAHGFEA